MRIVAASNPALIPSPPRAVYFIPSGLNAGVARRSGFAAGIVAALIVFVACERPEPKDPQAATPGAGAAGTVLITRTIGSWAYQDALHVAGMDVELVGGQPGKASGDAVIRFRLHGSLVSARRGWRPRIDVVHISQRFVQDANGEQAGEIELTPVVQVAKDAAYMGEPQALDLRVDETVSAYRWGQNRYIVRCGTIEKELQLFRGQ